MKAENIVPITELKRDAAALVERAAEEQNPIVITQNGRATAVLQDIRTFEKDRETLAMLQLCAQGTRDIAEGRTITHAESRRRIKRLLTDLRTRKPK
jgi:prevent-host-death family protein